MIYQVSYTSKLEGNKSLQMKAVNRREVIDRIFKEAQPSDFIYKMCIKTVKENKQRFFFQTSKRCDIKEGINYVLPNGKNVYADLHLIKLDKSKMTKAEIARAEYDRKRFIREWSLNPERLGEIVADEVAA